MTAVVRLALARPYTFVVMAILVVIFGVLSAIRTPTDIFPNIRIPVISVVWGYTGLSPDDMAGRIIAPYERAVSTTVNDIEHIELQSLPGMGVVKIFFQPNVDINAAQAQVTSISQTILKQLPSGATPPIILVYNASSVPIIQLALSSNSLSQPATVRSRAELYPATAHDCAWRATPVPLWRRHAPGADRSRPERAARPQSFRHRCRQCARLAEPDQSGRHGENRRLRIHCRPQRLAQGGRGLQQSAGQGGQRDGRVHARRRLRPRRLAAADQCR